MASRMMAAVAAKSFVARSVLSTPVYSTVTRPLVLNNNIVSSYRWYRGDSGDMKSRTQVANDAGEDDAIARREEALLAIAMPRSDSIHARHVRLPVLDEIPEGSLDHSSGTELNKEAAALQVRKKRLVYRSKQRGWLEVDLLLGTWAAENVPSLDAEGLDQFEDFVNMETIDIYNILTLRADVPIEMKRDVPGGSVVERIQDWVKKSPLGKAEPEIYKKVKMDNNLI
uniref:Succinate dehydrogenase assembly factor 2, mitochondrial n=1 Tax=Ditylum brightwellii TaxID=49249 RepID=A0A7S4T0K6_9STRA|mmetsp:Transcript_5733/g.7604  ORF Transcript_5733/g.7604 Transcript_5733/m.7604 type:complete len:227 (+) Transcript_5733:50-730(+)